MSVSLRIHSLIVKEQTPCMSLEIEYLSPSWEDNCKRRFVIYFSCQFGDCQNYSPYIQKAHGESRPSKSFEIILINLFFTPNRTVQKYSTIRFYKTISGGLQRIKFIKKNLKLHTCNLIPDLYQPIIAILLLTVHSITVS